MARVGPNAAIQTLEALVSHVGAPAAAAAAAAAGHPEWIGSPPAAMIPETDAARLHAVVRARHPAQAAAIALEGGLRTGDYILAHRIPAFAQAVLRVLPARLAAHALCGAITRHAWTFAGSGGFAAAAGHPVRLTISANPFIAGVRTEAPLCAWHAAVFERLFQRLVHPAATVREVACAAAGADACVFEVRWRKGNRFGNAAPGETAFPH